MKILPQAELEVYVTAFFSTDVGLQILKEVKASTVRTHELDELAELRSADLERLAL